MQTITIDATLFEVYADRVLWSPPSANGVFVPAPDYYASLACALVLCDYEDRENEVYVNGVQLYEHFIDTHDDAGREVPGGRRSGLHFPLKAGLPTWARPLAVQTGTLDGQPVVTVLEWDDPLNAVVTPAEIEASGLAAADNVRDALEMGWITGRKSGKTWLIRRADAQKRWG